jgi:hypothetical protein
MKRKRPAGPSATDLLEQAFSLLRGAPATALACYYTGSVPFVLGVLFFWTDMGHSAFARERVADSALGLAALFLWMKCWQAACAARWRAWLEDEPPAPWTPGRVARLVIVQTAIQPAGLLLKPLTLAMTIPYGWSRAFFENVTMLGDGSTAHVREVSGAAWEQAKLWQRQNHTALSLLTAFGLFVWLNVATLIFAAPWILKTALGVETVFTRSGLGMLNTTTLLATVGASYLCLGPVTKAFYALRCFHGRSLRSGRDLAVELRRLVATASLVLLLCMPSFNAMAAESATPVRVETVEPAQLSEKIDEVLARREFAWRLPRGEAPEEAKHSFLADFFEGVGKTIRDWLRPVGKLIGKILKKLDEWLGNRWNREHGSGFSLADYAGPLRAVLVVATALLAGILAFLIWKRWKQGRRATAIVAEALPAAPDLTADDVNAAQLPEDGWLRLAREMMERGELRLALRALFLAALAHLGSRELIAIARHKSNRDYERELHRRARTRDELLAAFAENRALFEGAWYGLHEVTREVIDRFSANVERIRAA